MAYGADWWGYSLSDEWLPREALWAFLDKPGQLLGAGGDGEQAGCEALVGADLGVEAGCSLGVVEQPDDLGVVAVGLLLDAGLDVCLLFMTLG